ncbi:chemokine-like receptor 1 [Pygocentrus nattereri]|uniref:G-protein coupled receptors family 1 profile domain-containing protein n=1 Tax=Pygocentrus nattereri TaxID=42514 RepID=A0A3B4CCD8_PYGNA|nr:chemokine-like receptor 1 [Pygocentrus nattereri]
MTDLRNVTAVTSNISNSKEVQQIEGLTYTQIFTLVSYIAIFMLGTVGNGLVMYVTGYKMKTTVNSIWFLNLAVADFLFTFFLILSIASVARKFDWPFGLEMCKFNTFVSVLNMFASIFLLTAISLDRCLSTWVIVWAQNKRTPLKARIACLFIWVGAIACSIPFASYRTLMPHGTISFCISSADTQVKMNLAVFRFVIGFAVPIIIIICSYIAIGVRARRLQKYKKLRPFRVILTVILAFFLCWLPFHIYSFCSVRSRAENWSIDAQIVIQTSGPFIVSLAYLNSCLNPILYVFMCEEFKTKLKQSLLLVLENAFTEEQLGFLTPRHSISSRHSESHIQMKKNDTTISLVSRLDRTSDD